MGNIPLLSPDWVIDFTARKVSITVSISAKISMTEDEALKWAREYIRLSRLETELGPVAIEVTPLSLPEP